MPGWFSKDWTVFKAKLKNCRIYRVSANTIYCKGSCCMNTCTKQGRVIHMCVRDVDFTYFYDFSIACWTCSNSGLFCFQFIIGYEKKPSWVPIIKKDGCDPSSVIKIVNMKYNRNDIKWRLISTSFKINLEILSNFYITFTIFYYNIISFRLTFFHVLIKSLYQTEWYS